MNNNGGNIIYYNPFIMSEIGYDYDYFIKIDNWVPFIEDIIFTQAKNAIIAPVSSFYKMPPNLAFDSFMINPKRCYNTPEVRSHICHYLNYFEKFYDKSKELLVHFCRIKALIDFGCKDDEGNTYEYTKENFLSDIRMYILSESLYSKVWEMVNDNYTLKLVYKNKTNVGLQYSDTHGKYFMEISFFMNALIPLLMHFIHKKLIMNNAEIEEIILTTYNWLFERYINIPLMNQLGLQPADMYSKLYETTNTTMNRDQRNNSSLWDMSTIRGMDPTINSLDTANTLIIQVMPKYKFCENIIMYNFTSIRNTIKYNVTDIAYEYDFVSLNSSKKEGEDNSSQFDKFEARLVKQDEAKFIQNKFNAQRTMEYIIEKFGPFDEDEIQFVAKELTKNGRPFINRFQTKLIFMLFFKYFGDTISIYSINARDYIILMLAAKKILMSCGMVILPYIISGNVNRLITRSGINKKETTKLELSEYFFILRDKYANSKMVKNAMTIIANIISSDFEIIEYRDPSINGQKIDIIPDYIIDEILCYINMI